MHDDSLDIATQVRDLRKQTRERSAALVDAREALSALQQDKKILQDEETQVFESLCSLRQEANDIVRNAGASASADLAEALLALTAIRIEEDKMTLEGLSREADKAREEAVKLTAMLRAQRAESERALKALSGEHRRVGQEADKQLAELHRYQRERQDIVARTDTACLKHARELFKVEP